MSNDNKTLADVKPGGRVRLGKVLPPLPRTHYNACGDGSEPLYTPEQMRDYARAALSAQPSPGGQGDLKSRFTEWVKANSYNPATFASGRYMGDGVQVAWEAVQALAARQPVEFERTVPTRRRESAVELLLTLGFVWNNQRWEDRRQPAGVPAAWMHTHKATGRVEFGLSPMYDYDFNAVQWDSVALYAAPAQAVDYQAALLAEERSHSETIDQRDRCEEVADELADRIARITGVDIGEHSSANCPWQNAIDAAEEYKPAQAVDLGTGVKAIAAERERQLHAECFTRDSDLQYRRGELAKAATAYVQLAAMDLEAGTRNHIACREPAAVWPWAPEWWKPVDARRDLVRAGALIAAQIDLIDSQAVGNG